MARYNRNAREAIPPADATQNRLPFVSFALLILVFGPIIMGVLIDRHERDLIESVRATQQHLNQVRTLTQVPRHNRSSRPVPDTVRVWRENIDTAVSAAENAQEHALTRVSDVHDIQDAVISVFGLLGLVAAYYSSRAVRQLRTLASANGRRVRALESLFDTAGHLSVSASPEAMHEYLTERVGHVLQARRVEMWRYDASHNVLYPLRPAFGFSAELPDPLTVRAGEWTHELLFQNAAICRNDFTTASSEDWGSQLRVGGAENALIVPLIAHNQPVGMLCAYDKYREISRRTEERAAFTEEDIQLLRTFATQAAFVLHSAQQYASARDRGEHLAGLARLTQLVNSSLELTQIVPTFLREAQALVPYRRARLALLPKGTSNESWSQEYPEADAEETELLRQLRGKTRAKTPFDATRQEPKRAQSASGMGNSVVDAPMNLQNPQGQFAAALDTPHPHPVYVWTLKMQSDASERSDINRQNITDTNVNAQEKTEETPKWEVLHPDDPLQKSLDTGETHRDQWLVIPLVAHDTLLGALAFEAGNKGDYAEHHLQLAQQAAGQLAAAVQNAQLYQEAMHRAQQLEWSMQETHHRIKNNLQAIMAILDLYAMEAEGDKLTAPDTEETFRQATTAREGLSHAMREVSTIAAVHNLISEDGRVSRVKADDLVAHLIPMLLTGPIVAGKHLHISTHADDLMLPSKLASALALAINELVVNAVRHGGKDRTEMTLRIVLHHEPQQLRLSIEDDGPGFPLNFDMKRHAKVGLNLTKMMIERDLRGTLTYANKETGTGATVTAHVPYKESSSSGLTYTH